MQAAKEAARNFLHKDRKHDTEVCEEFRPAVTKETIVPVEKVQETIAIDREVHQDHYQTRIQPVMDRVIAPETHKHHVVPVVVHETKHNKEAEIAKRLEAEAANFKSTTTVLPTAHEKIQGEVLRAEHVHHHVHEIVQPVIEREVVQPTVIHTAVPIHERIHHEPTFHPPTIQPKMTLEEFRRAGGTLDGRAGVCEKFDGEPLVKENGGADRQRPLGIGHSSHATPAVGAAGAAGVAAIAANTGKTRPSIGRRNTSASSLSSSDEEDAHNHNSLHRNRNPLVAH